MVTVGDQLDHALVRQVLILLRELARSRPWIKLMLFTGSKSQTARELEEGGSESPVSTIAGGTHYNSHALISKVNLYNSQIILNQFHDSKLLRKVQKNVEVRVY